jgi:hypothetical protein
MYVHAPGSVFIGSYTGHDVSMMWAGSRRIHITGSYVYTDVYLEAAGSLRAPIFYDSNDTSYYLDPNSNSNLWKFTAGTMARNDMNPLSANSPWSTRASQAGPYVNGSMGWGQVDLNTIGSYWGSGFIDTWSNPGNAPGGSTHYVGLQAMHYNDQNGNFHGWQMVCAQEATNRWFLRSSWNVPNRPWVEMIHSGTIGSQSVNYATQAGTASNANTVGGIGAGSFFRDLGFEGGGSNANTISETRSAFTYAVNAPWSGAIAYFGAGGYGLQLSSQYQGTGLSFRSRNGDNATWNSWSTVIHSNNIGSQSVNYANSAGGVSWGNVSSKPASWLNETNLIGDNGLNTAAPSGFWQNSGGSGNPVGTWFNYINVRHSNPGNVHGYQLGMSYYDNELRFRSYQGSGTYQSWAIALSSQNFTSYVNAPNAVGNGNGYYNVQNWLQVNGSHGIFWPGHYSFHIRPNISSTYTQMEIIGSKNSYGGIYDNHSAVNVAMYDSGGNGGVYREGQGRWFWYHHVGNNCTGISTSSTSSSYRAYIGGSLYAEGDVVAYSDVRKKTDIVTIDNALEKVINLRGVYYTRIDDAARGRQTGVIAQEVNQVLPEVVTYASDVDEYGVSYGNIVGVLIEAIKEQQLQIEKLQNKLDNVLSSR